MFWFSTIRILSVVGCVLLSACAVQPLYGTSTNENAALSIKMKDRNGGSDRAQASANKDEKELQQQLERLFAKKRPALYQLEITLTLSDENLLVQTDREVTQKFQRGKVRWTLYDRAGKKLISHTTANAVSYGQTGNNHFARLAAAKEAKEKLLERLAGLMQQRILSFHTQRLARQ